MCVRCALEVFRDALRRSAPLAAPAHHAATRSHYGYDAVKVSKAKLVRVGRG